jgi:tetratricopeptide (TPR) repeat protein
VLARERGLDCLGHRELPVAVAVGWQELLEGRASTDDIPEAQHVGRYSAIVGTIDTMPSAPPGKVPARSGSARPASRGKRDKPPIELRLAIGRDGLGIELAGAARFGTLEMTELGVTLPRVRFPVDVSGGVQRFRHRRGVLERLTLELSSDALMKDAAPRMRGLLAEDTPRVWVAVRPWGATVAVIDDAAGRIVAFEVAVDTFEDELRLTPFSARGINLHAPAVALSIQAMQGILGRTARREGARFVIEHAPERITRAVMPEAGARAPDCRGVRFTAVTCAADAWILHASRGAAASPPEEAVRIREVADLLREADDARVVGELDRARALDLYCLERAPKHPEICARIADIDRLASGRAEGARAILSDSSDATRSLALAAELAIEAGDSAGAAAALLRAADQEAVPALAAMELERAATIAPDPMQALEWLDRAIARAPSSARLHWTRCAMRLSLGRLRDAVADVEEIEAITRGAAAKHAAWRRAAGIFAAGGHPVEARGLFERALRFVPDDPEALAGLGAAMIAQGKVARGVALLSRALQHAERARRPSSETSPYALALARALADQLGDRPAAIARARTIGNADREAALARGLEGRWRAALGDKAGASLAYAQMRDLALALEGVGASNDTRAMLLEAASFERKGRADVPAAQAHLAVALRLFPRDAAVLQAYRTVTSTDVASDDARADELLARYRQTPEDERVVEELALVLTRLGRSHEVLALLASRYEDASADERARLVPAQIEVLARLERDARARGHDQEAQLFRDAIQQMGGAIEP